MGSSPRRKLLSHGWADHVGELELWVRAADEASVFVDALLALGELLSDNAEPTGEPESLGVVVEVDVLIQRHAARMDGEDRAPAGGVRGPDGDAAVEPSRTQEFDRDREQRVRAEDATVGAPSVSGVSVLDMSEASAGVGPS